MAFMEKELLSVKNPLYGRITGFYKLEELSFSEAQGMINQSSIEESVKYYGVLGGVPHYLKQIEVIVKRKPDDCLPSGFLNIF